MTRILIPTLAATAALWSTTALAQSDEADQFCGTAMYQGDTNADGMMSDEEITALRDAEFAALDANSDGSIDRMEYVNCIGQAQQNRQQAAAAAESSGDAEVGQWSDLTAEAEDLTREDWAELATEAWESGSAEAQASFARSSDMSASEGTETSEAERFAQAAVGRFQSHDTNGDGVLTQQEYETAAAEAEYDDQALEARFDTLDADGTGTVSPQEYRSAGTWAAAPSGQMDNVQQTGSDGSNTDDAGADQIGIPVIDYYMVFY